MSLSWNKIAGTQLGKFSLGFTGVTLKNNVGNLQVRNSADTAYTEITLNKILLDNNTGSTVIIQTSSTSSSYTLTLPSTTGTSGQVLSTDGAGNLSWVNQSGGSSTIGVSQLIAGNGITISPESGTGTVTISSSATVTAGVSQLIAGAGITLSPTSGTGTVTINSSAPTFPSQSGQSGKFLSTDGSSLTWAVISGGTGLPGGSDTQLQYNNGGAFGGIVGVTSTGTSIVFATTASISIGGGSSGQVLSTNGSGSLNWVNQSGGGGQQVMIQAGQGISVTTGTTTATYIISAVGTPQQDSSWEDVVLLLNFDEQAGTTNIVDSSPAKIFLGNIGSTAPCETSSIRTRGGYNTLIAPALSSHIFVDNYKGFGFKGDFTIEGWIYFTGWPTPGNPIGEVFNLLAGGPGTAMGLSLRVSATGLLFGYLADSTTTTNFNSLGTQLSLDTWVNVSFVRTSNTIKFFIDGIEVGSLSNNDITEFGNFSLGNIVGSISDPIFFDSWRVTNGKARYTANYTPPDVLPVNTAVAKTTDQYYQGVSILLKFDDPGTSVNTLIDSGPNNVSVIANGVSMSQVNSVMGGRSGSFGGTSRAYTTDNENLFSFSGDFTIEGWVYFGNVTTGDITFFSIDGEFSQDPAKAIFIGTTPSTGLNANLTCSVYGTSISTTGSVKSGKWYFIALVRKAGACTLYLDGMSVGTATITDTVNTGKVILGGQYVDVLLWTTLGLTGNLDDWRITRGIARYTDNFNSPTQPFSSEGSNTTALSIATTSTLGAIIVGSGLSITADGVLSASSSGTIVTTGTVTVNSIPTFGTNTGAILLDNPLTSISNGIITAAGFNSSSTARVKTNIQNISSDYLSAFELLEPKEYDRTDNNKHEFGFIAEEMRKIYPEIVSYDQHGNPSGIDYSKLTVILTAKLQEQSKELISIKALLVDLIRLFQSK